MPASTSELVGIEKALVAALVRAVVADLRRDADQPTEPNSLRPSQRASTANSETDKNS
jgi:hypothetical protein